MRSFYFYFPSASKWLIAPPIFGDEETPEVASGSEKYVSPPLPPVYQAGELSHYERDIEGGEYEAENEEQGFLPPPRSEPEYAYVGPPLDESLEGYVSPPRPDAGRWIAYPYYDYMFLTGQYPTGTYTYYSGGQEQGSDNFREDHYVREHPPYRSLQPLLANGGSRRGGAAVRPIQSRRTAKQPLLLFPAGGYGSNSNAVKVN